MKKSFQRLEEFLSQRRRERWVQSPIANRPSVNFVFRRGFTMIEILIVVVIAGLVAALALPGFVRAMQGARLRAAARTVATAHTFARNTAVLRQVPMALLIDGEAASVEVVSLVDRRSIGSRDRFLESRGERASGGLLEGAAASGLEIRSEVVRSYPEDIRVAEFASKAEGTSLRGIHWVNYFPNGMSDGFEITLSDTRGHTARVRSDPVSGGAEVVIK